MTHVSEERSMAGDSEVDGHHEPARAPTSSAASESTHSGPVALRCPTCAADCPAAARYCPWCGSELRSDLGGTERRIVTTLFADIVGFTALSELHDPEDVHAGLHAYFAMARATIERFGGSVEKFIGDAVTGVFGLPSPTRG